MPKKPSPDPAVLAQKQAHISVERYFEVSLLLMLGTSFTTLAFTGKLDAVSIVIVSAALILKLWSYTRERPLMLSPRTVTRLGIFYLFFFAIDFLILSPGPTALDSMLAATVHLILFATVVKTFSARTYRDYAYLASLSFMMMLASAILTVSTEFMALFVLYMLFAISTFISYEIKRSTEAATRAPSGPFASPARNRVALEQSLARSTGGLAIGIVALASVLFFVIPRYRSGYLTGLGMTSQNITGFSESVKLGDIGRILRSNTVVMRIMPENSPRDFIGVKWRGVGLTSFDGKHWYEDNTAQTMLPQATYRRFILPAPAGLSRRPYKPLRYRVLLSPLSTNVLFAAAVPREIDAPLSSIGIDETRSIHNPQHSFTPIQYDVLSQVGMPSPAQLRSAAATYPLEIRLLYLPLPPHLDPRIAALARRLTISAQTPYDRATVIQHYLRHNFAYTLNPPGIEPSDPIGSFLFTAKKGYCEYFAAAMAVMLRTLGVPTRLVNGFQTGSYNRIGHDFIVRERDAHSWVEVYFPEYGWVPFDPTPPDPNPVIPSVWDDYLDAASLFWNEWIINYDFAHQVQLARQVETESVSFRDQFRDRMNRVRHDAIAWAYRIEGELMRHKLAALIILMIAMAGTILTERGLTLAELKFLWAWTFPGARRRADPQEATMVYQRFLSALGRRGLRKPAAETPREFAARLARFPFAPLASEFTTHYNALRFGSEEVPLVRLRELIEQIGKSPKAPPAARG